MGMGTITIFFFWGGDEVEMNLDCCNFYPCAASFRTFLNVYSLEDKIENF